MKMHFPSRSSMRSINSRNAVNNGKELCNRDSGKHTPVQNESDPCVHINLVDLNRKLVKVTYSKCRVFGGAK